jgi:hypothetical protein
MAGNIIAAIPAVHTATKSERDRALYGAAMALIMSFWNAWDAAQAAADIEINEMSRVFCSLSMPAVDIYISGIKKCLIVHTLGKNSSYCASILLTHSVYSFNGAEKC